MKGIEALVRGFANDADGIDDDIDSLKPRCPLFRDGVLAEIAMDVVRPYVALACCCRVAYTGPDGVALCRQFAKQMRADKAGGAC